MEEKLIGLSRDFIIHPGETLKEMLDDRDMSQRELAIRTSVKEPHISNIVRGKKPLSVSFAKKLEYVFGVDASFWISLQSNYDKELADYKEINEISTEELNVIKKIKEIVCYAKDIGIINTDDEGPKLVIILRKLLNISNLTDISAISQSGAYRLSTADNVDADILFTWLRITDLITENQQLSADLNLDLLEKKLPLIKSLMFKDIETINIELSKHLAECGIKFAIVKHFKGAPVQGVIKRNDDKTLNLIMTLRRKYADVFWFTFFHEIGHILKGDIKDRLIDYEDINNEEEIKANDFAANILIDPIKYAEFVETGIFSRKKIKDLSEELNVPNFILIGRLQRDNHLSYSSYSNQKVRYDIDKVESQIRLC